MKTFALVIAVSITAALANSEPVVAREEGTHLRRMEGMPSPPQQMPNEAEQHQQRNPNDYREQFGWGVGPGLYGGGFYGGYPYGGHYGGDFYY